MAIQFIIIVVSLLAGWLAIPARAQSQIYYVDAVAGLDSNAGTSPDQAWQTVTKVNAAAFQPGDTVLFKRGSVWATSALTVTSSGVAGQPITFGAWGSASDPPPRLWRIRVTNARHLVFQDMLIDHRKNQSDAISAVEVDHLTLRNLEVRNSRLDCVNIDANSANSGSDNILIDGLYIHHCLAGTSAARADAHGITAYDADGFTIRHTEVHHVSGDAFQTDPRREAGGYPDNILIEGSHFWTGPLTEDFNAGWLAGDIPGENAVDTKVTETQANVASATRMRITIRDVVAHGWDANRSDNQGTFNMKEKIEAVFDRVTVYDGQVAFRLRGLLGAANTTIRNTVIYDTEIGIRAEYKLPQLTLQHVTFGDGIITPVLFADGTPPIHQWVIQNNAWLDAMPSFVTDTSNRIAAAADFVNLAQHDYHLALGSALIDAVPALPEVPIDRDGVTRPQGTAADVGAYEYQAAPPPPPPPSDDTISLVIKDEQGNILTNNAVVPVVIGQPLVLKLEATSASSRPLTITIPNIHEFPGAELK